MLHNSEVGGNMLWTQLLANSESLHAPASVGRWDMPSHDMLSHDMLSHDIRTPKKGNQAIECLRERKELTACNS